MAASAQRISTDALMEEIRDRIRRELTSEDARDVQAIEDLHAAVRRRTTLARSLVKPDSEIHLKTFVRFESHRGPFAPVVNFVKRRVLFPLSYWLFEFCRDNFEVQQELNIELLASVEVLALENAELRRRLERVDDLDGRAPSDAEGTAG